MFLGIDIGSSSCKAALVGSDGEAIASQSVPYLTARPRPEWVEQDPHDWIESAISAIASVVANQNVDPLQIEGIAFDGPAHVVALLDAQNRPLRPAIHWSDLRSAGIAQELWLTEKELILDRSLQRPDASWTLAQLIWVRRHEPDVWSRIHRILGVKDLVRRFFVGDFTTDSYDAAATQLFDLRRNAWSEELCELAELRQSQLPVVAPAESLAGEVSATAAARTGLLQGTPVAVGTGDSLAEALAIGLLDPGDGVIKLGTAANVSGITSYAEPSSQILTYRHAIPDRWLRIAATNSGAGTFRWLDECFDGLAGEGPSRSRWITDRAATVPPGSEGLLFHPYLQGERTPIWDPEATASFVGLTARHRLSHLLRAAMEGVAFSIKDCLSELEEENGVFARLLLIGKGSRDTLMRQILADVTGRTLTPAATSAAAIGSALLAAVATGSLSTVRDIAPALARTRPVGKSIHPHGGNQVIYEHSYRKYQGITRALLEERTRYGTSQ